MQSDQKIEQVEASESRTWTLRDRTQLWKLFSGNGNELEFVGQTICVCGWIKTIRKGKSFSFIKLGDGSTATELQIIADEAVPGYIHVEEHRMVISSSIMVIGEVVKSSGKGQLIEVKAVELRLLGASDAGSYPLAKKKHTVEYLRTIGHLRPRTNLISSITRVRNALAYATHKFFHDRKFFYINTPIITASDCEGAGEMFQVTTLLPENGKIDEIPQKDGEIDYNQEIFKTKSYLTVSGQLNAEIYACALGSVYTFGPTFRAEHSYTSRHLSEFWMIEPEIAFADLEENMDIAEAYVQYTLKYALETCADDFEFLEKYEKEVMLARKQEANAAAKGQGKKKTKKVIRSFKETPLRQRLEAITNNTFARVTYTDAIELLLANETKIWEEKPFWGCDLGSEHERWLAEEHFKKPVICYNYPKEFKAFYMRLNDDGHTVAAMDVLVPGVGELIGGSQREERLDVLLERLEEKHLEKELYDWYLSLREYGTVVHSGFGLGFERLVCYATGVENIRESIPFPRAPGQCLF